MSNLMAVPSARLEAAFNALGRGRGRRPTLDPVLCQKLTDVSPYAASSFFHSPVPQLSPAPSLARMYESKRCSYDPMRTCIVHDSCSYVNIHV